MSVLAFPCRNTITYNWDTIAGAIDIMSSFEEATADLSSQFYPSLSKVIPCVKIIQAKLSGLVSTEFNPWLINLLKTQFGREIYNAGKRNQICCFHLPRPTALKNEIYKYLVIHFFSQIQEFA